MEVHTKCFGCQHQDICWGTFPCETLADEEKADFYAQFSLQAYEFPSATNRVDLIRLGPYRLDLDLNGGTLIRYPASDLDPSTLELNSFWDETKENLMLQRMLGEVPSPLKQGPPAGNGPEPEDLARLGASGGVPALPAPPVDLDLPPLRRTSRSVARAQSVQAVFSIL